MTDTIGGSEGQMSEQGTRIQRHFTDGDSHPFDLVTWVKRDATIEGKDGAVFRQDGVTFPEDWSQTAVNIVASKYFSGHVGEEGREDSLAHLIRRVVETITDWGVAGGYFDSNGAYDESLIFAEELDYILLHQLAAFNTPVWLNFGVDEHPAGSACFINSVDDSMESIMRLARNEAMVFKHGSGSGVNLSNLRGDGEKLSKGGEASGPISFMRGLDAFAGVIKSGGRMRRAAKMVVLDVDHPDIMEFIECKKLEERKARALVAAGYDAAIDGEAYRTVAFQNANNSARVSNDFMKAVCDGENWHTRNRKTDGGTERPARDIFRAIAESAWECGDPGVQFSDTINAMNTCPANGEIRATNPCAEFAFQDNSACNLASINLSKFIDEDGDFAINDFVHVVRVLITAMDIIVDNASYPTKEIEDTSRQARPLGLGYASLGGMLMRLGVPYGSEEGRTMAALVTSLMTAAAYRRSTELAEIKGCHEWYLNARNKVATRAVVDRHMKALRDAYVVQADFGSVGRRADTEWLQVLENMELHGVRNAMLTLLAPTGTIAFMMDCDTTGIEPLMGLVTNKALVGGGSVRIVPACVREALISRGHSAHDITVFERDGDWPVDSPVFATALGGHGQPVLMPEEHLDMVAAVQPHLSSSVSKTINMPAEATVEDVADVYVQAWRRGLKAVSIYRDHSKSNQPVTVDEEVPAPEGLEGPQRERLPDTRRAENHKFSISGHDGYLTTGFYPDGRPGEIFLRMAKGGSVVSGFADGWALIMSIALQHGIPLQSLTEKLEHTRFEPAGFTTNPQIPLAKSILDYVARYLSREFPDDEDSEVKSSPVLDDQLHASQSSPPCANCGGLMRRSGTCYTCLNCGETTGCG